MVTRNWKEIKGQTDNNTGVFEYRTAGKHACPLYNVYDTSGEGVEEIMLACASASTSIGYSVGAHTNNLRLFSCESKDVIATNVIIAPSQLVGTSSTTSSSKAGGAYKFVFGSGSTTPKAEDYCMEIPIESDIVVQNIGVVSHGFDETTGNYYTNVCCSGVVTSGMTISEVGIVKSIWTKYEDIPAAGNANAENYTNILAVREVLPTPLNLKAGDSFTITIKVEM